MNDLETDLKHSLERAAGVPQNRAVPRGTLGRIRRRQVRTAGAGIAALAMFVGAVMVLASAFGAPPAEAPLSRPSVTKHATAFPRKIVAPTGSAPLDVTYGGDFTPYVDNSTTDGSSTVIGDKYVVSYGTIQGVPWSLVGFKEAMPGEGPSAGVVDTGQCAELSIGVDGDIHDTSGCYNPSAGDGPYLSVSGDQIAKGEISVFYGSADPQVARVELRFGDGSVQEITPAPGPAELGAGLFVVFMPGNVAGPDPTPILGDAVNAGTVVAFDASGNELAHGPICLGPAPSGTCGGPR